MGHHEVNDKMSAVGYVEQAREWSTRLEEQVAFRSGVTVPEARKIVAREIGAAPGTLENLRNRRLKGVAVHLYERLRARILRELEKEVRALSHEITIIAATGGHLGSDQMAEARESLKAVREALNLPVDGGVW